MKLYMRQKVFSWADKFNVTDELGADRYFIEGELFSWGKKLHVSDVMGREVAFIQQKVFSFLPRFFVFVNGVQVAEIVKEFTFFRHKYRIDGLGWEVEGDFFAHDYEIIQNGSPVVYIHKQWMSWGDSFELDIADGVNEPLALAVVLAIDCVLDAAQRANH
ncbi:MAG TPA: LURP-one-related family protein [Clostridia bacterium]|nr:MAG: hypothetical protein BWY35_00311 [Firmicutes bacterium ADurb.Bin248]HOG01824.1 LURP-one-related family protein [Clostridia bacterium]HOS18466.1 LURP-one-related family protein [Clostridia bacterium]HPK15952.1 LURP-one-related family protein [Clostridia bacterium]